MLSDEQNAYRCATDIEAIKRIADDIVVEEAWWIAARTRKYAQRSIIWADAPRCDAQSQDAHRAPDMQDARVLVTPK